MNGTRVVDSVLACLGGTENVTGNALCMTRLRVTLANPALADHAALSRVGGVLGCFGLGTSDVEIILGPIDPGSMRDELAGATGAQAGRHAATTAPAANFRVQVSPARRVGAATHAPAPHADGNAAENDATDHDAELLSQLARMLDADASFPVARATATHEAGSAADGSGRRVLVLNGPNINLLGIREPSVYGTDAFDDLIALAKLEAADAGFAVCRCYQSNHEGDLVDAIQSARGAFDGIVINPGAYTHTSVALLDALRGVGIPAVEVHISNVPEREAFRQVSYVRSACIGTVVGHGIAGYGEAIRMLAAHLGM